MSFGLIVIYSLQFSPTHWRPGCRFCLGRDCKSVLMFSSVRIGVWRAGRCAYATICPDPTLGVPSVRQQRRVSSSWSSKNPGRPEFSGMAGVFPKERQFKNQSLPGKHYGGVTRPQHPRPRAGCVRPPGNHSMSVWHSLSLKVVSVVGSECGGSECKEVFGGSEYGTPRVGLLEGARFCEIDPI